MKRIVFLFVLLLCTPIMADDVVGELTGKLTAQYTNGKATSQGCESSCFGNNCDYYNLSVKTPIHYTWRYEAEQRFPVNMNGHVGDIVINYRDQPNTTPTVGVRFQEKGQMDSLRNMFKLVIPKGPIDKVPTIVFGVGADNRPCPDVIVITLVKLAVALK